MLKKKKKKTPAQTHCRLQKTVICEVNDDEWLLNVAILAHIFGIPDILNCLLSLTKIEASFKSKSCDFSLLKTYQYTVIWSLTYYFTLSNDQQAMAHAPFFQTF